MFAKTERFGEGPRVMVVLMLLLAARKKCFFFLLRSDAPDFCVFGADILLFTLRHDERRHLTTDSVLCGCLAG